MGGLEESKKGKSGGVTKSENELDAFRTYLAHKNILVVESTSSVASSTIKTFRELGAKSEQITLANTFAAAIAEMSAKKPDIVLTEYDLGKSCGLDLFRHQRENNPRTKHTLFILVTGNSAESAVARAVDDDIDGFLLKPFRAEAFRKTILQSALQKSQPSAYHLSIEQGKNFIAQDRFDEAEKTFMAACALDPKPCLALYYLGQVNTVKNSLDKAKNFYEKGLEHNKIHYKCLIGLLEIFIQLKQYDQAYEVVKKLCQYFPANPTILADAVRLAITNAKYEDIEMYYSLYCKIENSNQTLTKNICAALVVCGKYYLQSNNRARGIDLFQRSAKTSGNNPKILKEIIQCLIDFGNSIEATAFLKYFPESAHNEPIYLILQFQITNITATNSVVIAHGHALLAKNISDEKFYEIMIKRAVEARLIHAADNFVGEASEKYPQLKQYFESLLNGISNETARPSQTQ